MAIDVETKRSLCRILTTNCCIYDNDPRHDRGHVADPTRCACVKNGSASRSLSHSHSLSRALSSHAFHVSLSVHLTRIYHLHPPHLRVAIKISRSDSGRDRPGHALA